MRKVIPYGRQRILKEDIDAVIDTLKSDFLTQGPKVKQFEENFADYIGSKYAVAVANGTAALHLSVLSLGIPGGAKVITSPLTFVATANAVLHAGGEIDFCDIDPHTLLMDINKLRKKLSDAPKGTYSGIIPVDFAGAAVKMDEFKALADEFNLWLLEDACHAPGGYFYNSSNEKHHCGDGNYADVAIFSFHPVKHIAAGEGGMITTNDYTLYQKLLKLRTHGITKNPDEIKNNHGGWYYEMQDLGYNYRLNEISCSLGLSQLNRAREELSKRKEIAQRYIEAFTNIPGLELVNDRLEGHAYHLFIIKTKRRKILYDYLKNYNIYPQIHYIPVHLQPFYQNLGFNRGDYPIVEAYYEDCITLPLFPSLTEDEVSYVIEIVKSFFID